jgi:hypothetical protein
VKALLDIPLRDALRNVAGYVFVGVVLCMPVAAELLRAGQ